MAAAPDTKWETRVVDDDKDFEEIADNARPFRACVSKRYQHSQSKRIVVVKFPATFPSRQQWDDRKFNIAKPLISWWECHYPEFEPLARDEGEIGPAGIQPKDITIRIYKAEKNYEYFNQREKVPIEFNADKYFKATLEVDAHTCSKCKGRLFANGLSYTCFYPAQAPSSAVAAAYVRHADLKGAVGMVFTKNGVNYEVRVPVRVGNPEDWEAGGKDNWSVALPAFEEWNSLFHTYTPDPAKKIFIAGPWPECYGAIEVFKDAGPLEPMVRTYVEWTNGNSASPEVKEKFGKLTDHTVFYYPSFAEDARKLAEQASQTKLTLSRFVDSDPKLALLADYIKDPNFSRFSETPRSVMILFLALLHRKPSIFNEKVSVLISPPKQEDKKRARDEEHATEETDAKRQATQAVDRLSPVEAAIQELREKVSS